MTPRKLDWRSQRAKLRRIRDLLDDLRELGSFDTARPRTDRPAMLPSAGMRNVLVHHYLDVDYQRVATAIPLAVEQYGEYVRQVARWLQERAE